MTKCAIIGLGEAGSVYAAALVDADHEVTGFDPVAPTTPPGVLRADSGAAACRDADIVLVFTGASVARRVAEECLPVLATGTTYADFTTSTPASMKELSELPSDADFVDVAILGPIPTHGALTPLMVSGPGSAGIVSLLTPLGTPIETVAGPPGEAMAHKFLRSVLMKGLASVVVEAVSAGRAAGHETWIRDQISAQLAGDGQSVIDRFLIGTQKHAGRRSQEMRDTSAYLADMGVPSEMSTASAAALTRMATTPPPA